MCNFCDDQICFLFFFYYYICFVCIPKKKKKQQTGYNQPNVKSGILLFGNNHHPRFQQRMLERLTNYIYFGFFFIPNVTNIIIFLFYRIRVTNELFIIFIVSLKKLKIILNFDKNTLKICCLPYLLHPKINK